MRVKDAARIFSSSYLKKLASGDYSLVSEVAHGLNIDCKKIACIGDFYDRVYKELDKHYRYEYYFKNTIANKLLLGRHSLNTATMLSEFRVGKNIADCVILNGHSTCYEIKTQFDSLTRLEEQLSSYCSLFDKVYVVCNEKHLSKVQEVAPPNVGLLQLTQRNTLSEVRKAQDLTNLEIDTGLLMNSLRADEYKLLAKLISGSVPNVSNIKMYSACEQIISGALNKDLRLLYKTILKESRRNDAELINLLPKSLINAGVSYKLPNSIQRNLINILHNDFSKGQKCTTQFSEVSSLS